MLNRNKSTASFWLHAYFLLLCLFVPAIHALDKVSLNVDQITSEQWQLHNIKLFLFDLSQQTQQFSSTIEVISLPEPFSVFRLFNIRCQSFNWRKNKITCEQGKAQLQSELFYNRSPSSFFDFSLTITDKQSDFIISNLKFAEGRLALHAKLIKDQWILTLKSNNVQLHRLATLLKRFESQSNAVNKGQLSGQLRLSGNHNGLTQIILNTQLEQLTLQAKQGKFATDSLGLQLDISAKLKKGLWHWQHYNQLNQGELFIDPVYININEQALSLQSKGQWSPEKIQLTNLVYRAPKTVSLTAQGLMHYKDGLNIDEASVHLDVNDIELFSRQYMFPFVDQSLIEGVNFKGRLKSELSFENSSIIQALNRFEQLSIIDNKHRLEMENGEGEINWSVDSDFIQPSIIRWENLEIKQIPFDRGKLQLLLNNKQIRLLQASQLSVLDGKFEINRFQWLKQVDQEPTVYFEGGLNHVSLDKLSEVLGWVPLSGQISGYIPGVQYENKTLTAKGELKVNLFDGMIRINKLASSGLFTDFSRFSMDMAIDNLDLQAITRKFQIGGMEGRVSGVINNLYLENWEPVTFYAWIGTPEDDNSTHRISQKAVENIASIGGSGASDIISKGFLRFFDTFSYDKLGFGCYLHQGVCQLMGVEAAEQGYYIVKGGGVPRIDVIAYNPQVDWKVLMQRLARIFTANEVVIQ